MLTAVADIGTVYWRYECTRDEPRRWALGVLILQIDFGVAGCSPWETPNVTLRTYVIHH